MMKPLCEQIKYESSVRRTQHAECRMQNAEYAYPERRWREGAGTKHDEKVDKRNCSWFYRAARINQYAILFNSNTVLFNSNTKRIRAVLYR